MFLKTASRRLLLSGLARKHFHATPRAQKVVSFKLADIGEGIAEVEVLNWFVNEGDKIQEFDPVCEVQSDKATVEITSRYDGTVIKKFYEVGDIAKVGLPLIDIDDGEISSDIQEKAEAEAAVGQEKAEATIKEKAETAKPVAEAVESSTGLAKVTATPAVRQLIKAHRIKLQDVLGTGKQGRVLKGDVLKHIETEQEKATGAVPKEADTVPKEADTVPKEADAVPKEADAIPRETPALPESPPDKARDSLSNSTVIKLTAIQRAMAGKMEEALRVPHFGYCDQIDVEPMVKFRESLNNSDKKVSYLPIMIKAAAISLEAFPELNAHYNQESIEQFHNVNMTIAVDTPSGLMVPNIKDCGQKSIYQIADEIARLASLGKENKLGAAELEGGTFTLSNIGSIGGTYASPVLLVPQIVIGALGKMHTVDGSQVMNVSWAADHRVVDGATMARFSNMWIGFLENPESLIGHL
jgi:2-oxoisovalerate dehydrogenase E2 component (dihydrolipoyl transacylase)